VIDDLLPSQWPQPVLDAVRQFRQGNIVDRPPFFYLRRNKHPLWMVQLEPEEPMPEESLVDLEPSDRPPYGLITTQTCDLYEEGDHPRQPWFAVAPVYDYKPKLKSGQLEQIRRGQVGHLVLLTAEWFGQGAWVADLRVEVPLEKGWLVGREPHAAFASQTEYKTLAARLAMRRGRPALSGPLTQQIVMPLRAWLGDKGRWHRDEVESLRLLAAGDPATSLVACLVVVAAGNGLSDEAQAVWRLFEADLIDSAAEHGVTALPFRYGTYDDLTGRETEASVRLDFDYRRGAPDGGHAPAQGRHDRGRLRPAGARHRGRNPPSP
jgi:hypothetical protein